MMAVMQVRPSQPTDRPFLIELARLACALDGHPLPAGDDPEVLAILPGQTDGVVIAADEAGHPIGGAWWHLHSPPLVRDAEWSCRTGSGDGRARGRSRSWGRRRPHRRDGAGGDQTVCFSTGAQ